MDHPLPWLRYVDAEDLNDNEVTFDGLKVTSSAGEKLGEVDGFVVDSESGRPYYVAVDAGGWFKSKLFLLPVGHARLDAAARVLVTDVPQERIKRFPGFDKDNFEKLSAADLKRMNDETCQACEIEGVVITYSADEPYSAAWQRSDFRYPDWWRADARDGAVKSRDAQPIGRDASPHFGGRAQPGDVLGVETSGERTYIGDTAEDENERREEVEKELAERSHVRK